MAHMNVPPCGQTSVMCPHVARGLWLLGWMQWEISWEMTWTSCLTGAPFSYSCLAVHHVLRLASVDLAVMTPHCGCGVQSPCPPMGCPRIHEGAPLMSHLLRHT